MTDMECLGIGNDVRYERTLSGVTCRSGWFGSSYPGAVDVMVGAPDLHG